MPCLKVKLKTLLIASEMSQIKKRTLLKRKNMCNLIGSEECSSHCRTVCHELNLVVRLKRGSAPLIYITVFSKKHSLIKNQKLRVIKAMFASNSVNQLNV